MRVALIASALIAGALLLGSGTGEAGGVHAATTFAGGSFSISNSRQGAAIFQAENIGPGDGAGGSVTIANTGTLDGVLLVGQDNIADVPGPGGGALSGRLDLEVQDVTNPSAPVTFWGGKLASMPPLYLGTLAAGGARTFAFTASLPHGAGDNAFASSAMSSRFVWTAAAEEAAPPSTKPPVKRDPGPRLRLRVPGIQRIVTRRQLVAYVSCNEPCRMAYFAQVPAGRGRRIRTKKLHTGRIRGNRRTRLIFRIPRSSVEIIRRALLRHRPTSITLTIIAKDDGGNTLVLKRKVEFAPVSRRGGASLPSAG